jgi:hypothetical protein
MSLGDNSGGSVRPLGNARRSIAGELNRTFLASKQQKAFLFDILGMRQHVLRAEGYLNTVMVVRYPVILMLARSPTVVKRLS